MNNLSKWKSSGQSLSILLTGKIGSGKSNLANGILGLKREDAASAAKQGDSIKARCTTEVTKNEAEKNGVTVTVWDCSPGLQDGTEDQDGYIQQMKENCSKVDLVKYFTKVTETRFVQGVDNPDVVAMKKITKAFNHEFWRKAVIILTYANMLDAFNVEWEDLEFNGERAKAFNAKIKEWKEQINKVVLTKDVNIPNNIVDNITIVPAGHQCRLDLTGQEYWLSNRWFQCFSIPFVETHCALLQINLARFKEEDEVKKKEDEIEKKDDKVEKKEQLEVEKEEFYKKLSKEHDRVINCIIGAIIGGTFAGPFGAIIGALIGGSK